jgi:hypothetical protein
MMKVYYPLLATTGTAMTATTCTTVAAFMSPRVARQSRTLVTLHGNAALTPSFRLRRQNGAGGGTGGGIHNVSERPPDPNNFLTAAQQEEQIHRLLEWWQDKSQVLCITGAGVSTESGIPDYRGHGGSYHKGHKPMVSQAQLNRVGHCIHHPPSTIQTLATKDATRTFKRPHTVLMLFILSYHFI